MKAENRLALFKFILLFSAIQGSMIYFSNLLTSVDSASNDNSMFIKLLAAVNYHLLIIY